MNTAKIYKDSNGDDCTILQMVKREPFWAANRIQEMEKAIEELQKVKNLDEAEKNWYRCSCGENAGYCDGKEASHCQYYLDTESGQSACELAL